MTETINQRIRKIRKAANMNQLEFSSKIGVKRVTVSWLEKDGNTVTEQNRRIICDKFNISMDWLLTGAGDMYQETDEAIVNALKKKYNFTPNQIKLMDIFLSMSEEKRERVAELFFNFIDDNNASKSAQSPAVDPIKQEVTNYEAELRAQQEAPSASAPGNAKKA